MGQANRRGCCILNEHINQLLQHDGRRNTLVSIEIAGNPRSLALVRKILTTCSLSLKLPKDVLNDIKLAVTEACTNVIKHAYQYDYEKRFGLSIELNRRIFLVKVTYVDQGFNPDSIPIPDLNDIKEGGLGVFIIRNIMDDVVYSIDSATGTVCLCMSKFLPNGTPHGGASED